MLAWSNWLTRRPFTAEIAGSYPAASTLSKVQFVSVRLAYIVKLGYLPERTCKSVHRNTPSAEDWAFVSQDLECEGRTLILVMGKSTSEVAGGHPEISIQSCKDLDLYIAGW